MVELRFRQKKAVDDEEDRDGDDGDQILHGAGLLDDQVPGDNEHQHFQQRGLGRLAEQPEKLDDDHDAEHGADECKKCVALIAMLPELQKWLP